MNCRFNETKFINYKLYLLIFLKFFAFGSALSLLFLFDFSYAISSLHSKSNSIENVWPNPSGLISNYHYNSNEKSTKSFVNNRPIFKVYGPLSLDLNNVQFKKNTFFIPVLNDDNKPLFLAINCSSKLFNVKASEDFKGWFEPFFNYEINIVNDFCNFQIQ
tara:strand:- start:1613 stop:2095 length:483 start_codon:yes stop_codon:yes gene_type:complete